MPGYRTLTVDLPQDNKKEGNRGQQIPYPGRHLSPRSADNQACPADDDGQHNDCPTNDPQDPVLHDREEAGQEKKREE